MRCPGCDAENPGLASFCYACGTRLTSLAKSKSGAASGAGVDAEAAAGTGGGGDAKLGLVETAPFESSPLGPPTSDRLREGGPSALTDTLIDMSPEAVAALTRAVPSANDSAAHREPPTMIEGGAPARKMQLADTS